MNYRVTLSNYKEDGYYPKVVRVVDKILENYRTVRTVDVFRGIGVVDEEKYKKWKMGQVKCFEFVIGCNLSKANRIMSILGFYAHDLNMGKSHNFVKRKGNVLRYSKYGSKKVEELYARQFNVIEKGANKRSQ